jgi:hypothetical protein
MAADPMRNSGGAASGDAEQRRCGTAAVRNSGGDQDRSSFEAASA